MRIKLQLDRESLLAQSLSADQAKAMNAQVQAACAYAMSEITILTEQDEPLFVLRLNEHGQLLVEAYFMVTWQQQRLSDELAVIPKYRQRVAISRLPEQSDDLEIDVVCSIPGVSPESGGK